MQILVHLITICVIWSGHKFFICHDSLAIITYTKLRSHLIITFQVKATQIFTKIRLWAHKPFVNWSQVQCYFKQRKLMIDHKSGLVKSITQAVAA